MNRNSYNVQKQISNSRSGILLAFAIVIPGLIGLIASDSFAQPILVGLAGEPAPTKAQIKAFNKSWTKQEKVLRKAAVAQNRVLLQNAGNAAVNKRVAANIATNSDLLQKAGNAAVNKRVAANIARNSDLLQKAGNAAVNKRVAANIARNSDLLQKAGNAAVNKRIAIRAAQNGDVVLNAGHAALKNRKTLQQLRQSAKTTKNLRRAVIAGTGIGVVWIGGMWIAESLLGDSLDDIAIDAVTSLAEGKRVDQVIGQVGKRLDPARLGNNLKRNLDKTGKDVSNAFKFVGRELGKIRL